MNPGYQTPASSSRPGPIDPDVSSCRCSRADGQAARPAGQLLAALRRRRASRCRPTTSAPSPSASASCSAPTRRAAVRRHHVQRHQRRHQQRQLRRRRPRQAGAPYEQIRVVADSVAKAALEAYKKIKHRDWVPLAMAEKEIELGVRLPTRRTSSGRRRSWPRRRSRCCKTLPEVYARETVLLAKYPPKVKVMLQALRIGDLGIAAIPCEVFVEIGLEIKKKSPLQADVHHRAGQRLQRLPADAGAAQAGRLRDLAGAVELPGGGRLAKITATLLDLLKEVATALIPVSREPIGERGPRARLSARG